MQIEFIHILYSLVIIASLLILIKFFNKKHIFKGRVCRNFKEQVSHASIVKNNIDENIVKELYYLIGKYFKVKTCYLYPSDTMKTFYDLSSFELHENYEEFITYINNEFNYIVELDDELINLMINMSNTKKR